MALCPARLHASTHIRQDCRPAWGRQVFSLTTARPMRTRRFSSSGRARMAPVGQTCPQMLQPGSQPARLPSARGVHSPPRPCPKPASWRVPVGQAFTHDPQRTHMPRNSASGTLPGGRTAMAARPAPSRWPRTGPTASRAAAPPAAPARKPRRESGTSPAGCSSGGFRSSWRPRGANSIAPTGQTPPQVWQKVQLAGRVVKSALMASKGQTSAHLPQPMQPDETLRSKTRSRLPIEKTAPVGHR